MNNVLNKGEKNQIEILVELSVEELAPYIKKAVKSLAENVKIQGFRPGTATLEVLKNQLGEMAVYEEAAYIAMTSTAVNIIKEKNLKTIGKPELEIVKIAPNNPFSYKIKASLFPEVTLPKYETQKIKRNKVSVSDEEVKKVLKNLQKNKAIEKAVNRECGNGDKVVLDFDIYFDKVVIENGSYKKYPVILGEGTLLPEFEKNVIGLKENEEKNFPLTFPKDYFEKNLQGKKTEVKLKVLAVYELVLPELNDVLAKDFGVETIDKLKENITAELGHELEHKEEERLENEIFDYLIKNSKFGDIPENLVNSEVKAMLNELQGNLDRYKISFEDYLKRLNKKESELILDLTPNALRRVKSSLVIYEISDSKKIKPEAAEVNAEVNRIKAMTKDKKVDESMMDRLYDYVYNTVVSNKVIKHLKETMLEN